MRRARRRACPAARSGRRRPMGDSVKQAKLLAHVNEQEWCRECPQPNASIDDQAPRRRLFPNINIAFVNQACLTLLCKRMGLRCVGGDRRGRQPEAVRFMKFTPGPNDKFEAAPSTRTRCRGAPAGSDFIDRLSRGRPRTSTWPCPGTSLNIVAEARRILGGRALHGGRRSGVLGVAFKARTSRTPETARGRSSPAVAGRGADVRFHDPLVDSFRASPRKPRQRLALDELLGWADVIVDRSPALARSTGPTSTDARTSSPTRSTAGRGSHVGPRRVLRLGAGWSSPA